MTLSDVWLWGLASLPILTVLILMIKFRWGGARAGAAGWFMAMAVAGLAYGANAEMLIYAQTKGVLLTLYVLYIVWAALLLYFVTAETGAIETIAQSIQQLTANRELQLLIVGWVFSTFLQGVAGFGVPIAVVAPLLLGMGFSPLVAVAAPAIGHSWSVTFGNMATSFEALIAVTGLEGATLTHWSAILLGISCFLCGWAVLMVYGGWKSARRGFMPLLIIGTAMSVTQYFLVMMGPWTVGGFTAGIVGLLISIPVARLFGKGNAEENEAKIGDGASNGMSLGWALSAYLIFIAVITIASFVTPVNELLDTVRLTLGFPALETAEGWTVKAGTGKVISVFGHPGAHLFYTAVLSFLLYYYKGFYSEGVFKRVMARTVKSGTPTSLGMVSMVCFAVVMDHSGMTYMLAKGIGQTFSAVYPMVSVAIGALGAFMTGSTTNSNVVFGVFQRHAAELAGYNIPIILAAQTTGGSLGSMLAPAKILVGCSTVGLAGKEGEVLSTTLRWGAYLVVLTGLATFALIYGFGA
ncbi:MAG: L-lactate permease [Rhodospirillales bacterium]|nr:L-lactate permease [Rhodospirillales bacterium]